LFPPSLQGLVKAGPPAVPGFGFCFATATTIHSIDLQKQIPMDREDSREIRVRSLKYLES